MKNSLLIKQVSFITLKLTITAVDKRKTQLLFKALVIEMAGSILVDFRLSKVKPNKIHINYYLNNY